MKQNVQLLIVDPQVDFCEPGAPLAVPGAKDDCSRLAKMLARSLDLFDDILVTLDSHQPVHIAHALCWADAAGNHPAAFTIITEDDVLGKTPKWRAFNPAWQDRQVAYVQALKAGRRYQLCIWPPHCLIGTRGHTIMPEVSDALRLWQDRFFLVDFVAKGANPHTEHYSVVKADVVDPADPSTALNTNLIKRIQAADELLVCGEALSHCVANSVVDIAKELGEEHIKKIVLLLDACSPVSGFEAHGENFLKEMTGRGMRVARTTDI